MIKVLYDEIKIKVSTRLLLDNKPFSQYFVNPKSIGTV